MFYVIGLGLCDEKDITVRGLEAVKSCSRVYLEAYTSILMVNKDRLEAFYGKSLILADRDMVELESDDILRDAATENVAFLVVGDPFGATTHTDLLLRARDLQIPTQIIHNASIINAVGCSGLQLYNFGQTVSLVFFTDTWKPDSFYDRIAENAKLGLHTLVLLDIKVKEQSEENLARGRKIYEPPRYMSIPIAVNQLLEIESIRKEGILDGDSTLAIALSRVGSIPSGEESTDDDDGTQRIVAGTLSDLQVQPESVFGKPLHSLIIAGKRLHELEAIYAGAFAVNKENWNRIAKQTS
ncbi:Diphthine synthase [Suillus fuscotomentosus]|uniref:diphthine methyl ester synthase n=1 Tax=Suillus fuscotomentosus TaxID=1912939 RepID=A0AAD4EBX9_9AGAM|nr:Diphthine synthase [Suillus fuscotomentosus]KAG1856882.1 diphthine synthase isoform b [Suillus tomentosus]KAG1903335.1 Diphthine synthase [Suillus fuscotomentosus]